jgi:hypothetical protein
MSTTLPTPRRYPGRLLVALGLLLAALGIAGYAAQLAGYADRLGVHRLYNPWYVPIAATVGALLLVASLWQARSVWRWVALVLLVLLAGFEWTALLGARLPAYAGPVAKDKPFPEFTTERADGTAFTQRDLEGEDNVLVFFRGRW